MQGSRFSLTSSSVYSEGTDMRINQLKEPGVLSCVHRIDTTFMISQHQHQCIVCGILYECKKMMSAEYVSNMIDVYYANKNSTSDAIL